METKTETKVIEIEIAKPEKEIPSAPLVHITEQPIPEAQITHIKPTEISTVRPPPIRPELSGIITEQPDYMGPPTFDPESDVTTSKLWKKRDGRAMDTQDRVSFKLDLITEITDFLKDNEPKKTYSDAQIIRRPRKVQSIVSESERLAVVQKKRNEKKPRKDCVCGLEKVEGERRNKLANFVAGLSAIGEEKLEEIINFAQNVLPNLNLEEQMDEDQQDVMVQDNDIGM